MPAIVVHAVGNTGASGNAAQLIIRNGIHSALVAAHGHGDVVGFGAESGPGDSDLRASLHRSGVGEYSSHVQDIAEKPYGAVVLKNEADPNDS